MRFFIGLSALLLIAIGAYLLIEAAFSPWARSLTGGPTLTGQWLGEMTTATGRKHWVWLLLEHPLPSGRCSNCPSIDGDARTCEAREGIRNYSVRGDVENWRGTRFVLKTRDEKDESGRLLLGVLHGEWSGDVIDVTTQLIVPGAPITLRWEKDSAGNETTTVVGGHPDARSPVRWRMQRGTEQDFEARCTDLTP